MDFSAPERDDSETWRKMAAVYDGRYYSTDTSGDQIIRENKEDFQDDFCSSRHAKARTANLAVKAVYDRACKVLG